MKRSIIFAVLLVAALGVAIAEDVPGDKTFTGRVFLRSWSIGNDNVTATATQLNSVANGTVSNALGKLTTSNATINGAATARSLSLLGANVAGQLTINATNSTGFQWQSSLGSAGDYCLIKNVANGAWDYTFPNKSITVAAHEDLSVLLLFAGTATNRAAKIGITTNGDVLGVSNLVYIVGDKTSALVNVNNGNLIAGNFVALSNQYAATSSKVSNVLTFLGTSTNSAAAWSVTTNGDVLGVSNLVYIVGDQTTAVARANTGKLRTESLDPNTDMPAVDINACTNFNLANATGSLTAASAIVGGVNVASGLTSSDAGILVVSGKVAVVGTQIGTAAMSVTLTVSDGQAVSNGETVVLLYGATEITSPGTAPQTNVITLSDPGPGLHGLSCTLYNLGPSYVQIDKGGNFYSSTLTIAPSNMGTFYAIKTNGWAGK